MDQLASEARKAAEDAAHYIVYAPQATLGDLLAYAMSLGKDYLWQKDSFSLSEAPSLGSGYYQGTTRVGDCIQDEWFIVWILQQTTQVFPGSLAAITDADGQFILIEGAEALPKWVTPFNADNRVWFKEGRLHLIPLRFSSERPSSLTVEEEEVLGAEATAYISPTAAVDVLLSQPDTLAPPDLENVVFNRISSYPSAIQTKHLHRSLAYLPDELIVVLQVQPQLIAQAVTAFYERDPVQLKACQTMSRFPPSSSSRLANVQLTRTLYAQLIGQKFFPPKPFEKARWFQNTAHGSTEWKRKELGMKITCGFEMLYQETRSSLTTHKAWRDADQTELSNAGPYQAYLAKLAQLGFFSGEQPGSHSYTKLEALARERFAESQDESRSTRPTFAQSIEAVLSSGSSVHVPAPSLEEDSDEWLDLDPQSLDALLNGHQGSRVDPDPADQDEDAEAQRQAEQLGSFAEKIEGFVKGKGSLQGALFDDEISDDDSSDDEAEPSMTNEEKQAVMDKFVPALPASEWGQATQNQDAEPKERKEQVQMPEAKLEAEKYDGVSDDESDDDEQEGVIEELADDDPQIEAEEIDMDQEMDDFLKFTREALGLSEDQYNDILQSRSDRGAFVPPKRPAKREKHDMDIDEAPGLPGQPQEQAGPVDYTTPLPTKPAAPFKNPKLNDFEALMDAMDSELRKAKAKAQSSNKSAQPTGPASAKTAKPDANMQDADSDDEAAMEAELQALLNRDPEDMDDPGQLHLIKNLLASFDSQQGFAGPVSSLAGRLDPGLKLPRDAGDA